MAGSSEIRRIISGTLFAAFVSLIGCDGAPNQKTGAVPSPNEPNLPERNPSCVTTNRRPLIVGFEQDKTKSAESTPTPQLIESDFLPIYASLHCSGGEIAFGVISANSNQGLVRLRVEEPPLAPDVPVEDPNPLVTADKLPEYEKKAADYETNLRAWEVKTQAAINRFREQIQPLLDMPAHYNRTDFNTAIERLELFHAEPRPDWEGRIRSYSVVASDADDNVHNPAPKISGATRLLLVFGGPIPASVRLLNPIPFENAKAAIRYITVKED